MQIDSPGRSRFDALRWAGVLFAIAFPTLITWVYFVLAGRYSQGVQQSIYLTVKIIQFAFPAAWTWFALGEALRTGRPTAKGLLLGALFSAIVVAAGMVLFHLVLRQSPVFATAAGKIHQKIELFGINTAAKFFLLAGFYSLFHSLLEEYYWRWFVYHQLRKLVPMSWAVLVSGLAFMLHHVVVLREFFHEAPWLVALLSGAIAVGGFFWAWLFERSGSIFDSWLSHLLIDAGIFFGVGYPLVRHMLGS